MPVHAPQNAAAALAHVAPPRTFCAPDRLDCGASDGVLRIRAEKAIDAADVYLPDHFPGFTIFPGLFVLEVLNQAVVAAMREICRYEIALDTVMSMRFLAPLLAGDRLTLDAVVAPLDGEAPVANAVCRRGDGRVCARPKVRFRRLD